MSSTATTTATDLSVSSPSCVADSSAPITLQNVEQGKVDTVQTDARFLAYFARLRPLLLPATRYLAYTSDVGEAFRPNVTPRFVTAAYGISWLYLGGDCAYEGYKAHIQHRDALRLGKPASEMPAETTEVGLRVVKRAVFQTLASMLFPALTIHSAVKYSAKYGWAKSSAPRLRAWGPTLTGLAIVPVLPYLFDERVEHAVDFVWRYVDDAVRPSAAKGKPKVPEKEL